MGADRPVLPEAVARGLHRDVLVVSGPEGSARRYRGDHVREQLLLAGCETDVAYRAGLPLERLAPHYDTIALYRVAWDDEVAALLEAARAHDCRVLCDFDDLVFDPDRKQLIRGRDRMTEAERTEFDELLRRLARTLAACDGAIVSTDALAEAARRHNASVAVAYNAVSAEMVAAAARARRPRPTGPAVTIAYLSGTPTHDRDIAEAVGGLARVLDRHPHARLLLAGFVDLDERLARFGARVERVPYRRWSELPELLARVDVNLAPLEPGNAFVDAKSCLKYLEAGLLGVPTVASPRPDFERAIVDGQNGLLAEGDSAWADAIERLVASSRERERIGGNALDDVLARHTTAARAPETAGAYASIAARPRQDPPL